MVFYVKVDNGGRDHLLDAISQFSLIAENVDIKFSPLVFFMSASNPSFRFNARMQISHKFFTQYVVNGYHLSRVSLNSFRAAMLEGSRFSSMAIHLVEERNQINLIFSNPRCSETLQHGLQLSPAEGEIAGITEYGNFFSIDSQAFRYILDELPLFQNASLLVTVTSSQVKFSTTAKEIILTQEDQQCEIVGYEEEVETQFRITLMPTPFFRTLSYNEAGRVWFYRATNSYGVIAVPAFGHAQYVILFSPV